MPMFTFDGVTVLSGGGVASSIDTTINNSTGTPNAFFRPGTPDTQSAPFTMGGRSYLFTGVTTPTQVYNYVWRMGHNMDSVGGAIDPARPVLKQEFEQNYFANYADGARVEDILVTEWHLVHTPPGGSDQRLITTFCRWNGATTPTNNNLKFFVEQLQHRNAANNKDFWTCDSTQGFQIADWPLGVNITTTSKIPFSINVPISHNADMFRVNYNAATFMYLTKFGELAIDSSATQSGSSVLGASLYVRGRVGSTYNFYVLASDGNARIRVNQSTGATGIIIFNSQFQNYGSFDQYNAAGSTLLFQIGGTGNIRTNQRVAGTTLGSVTGKIEIFNESGVSQGFLPLYNSIT